jgi:hypothetical protein
MISDIEAEVIKWCAVGSEVIDNYADDDPNADGAIRLATTLQKQGLLHFVDRRLLPTEKGFAVYWEWYEQNKIET